MPANQPKNAGFQCFLGIRSLELPRKLPQDEVGYPLLVEWWPVCIREGRFEPANTPGIVVHFDYRRKQLFLLTAVVLEACKDGGLDRCDRLAPVRRLRGTGGTGLSSDTSLSLAPSLPGRAPLLLDTPDSAGQAIVFNHNRLPNEPVSRPCQGGIHEDGPIH